MPDWLDGLIKIVTFVLAFYGVMSAFAAKRSAIAAETQAKAAVAQAQHAESQANAAIVQARAAERQLDLAMVNQQDDRITRAMRARRTVLDCRTAVKELEAEVLRFRDGNAIATAHRHAIGFAAAIEDTPPIFPKNVRRLMHDYVQRVQSYPLRAPLQGEAPIAAREHLDITAETLVIAMDTAITAMIKALPENESLHAAAP